MMLRPISSSIRQATSLLRVFSRPNKVNSHAYITHAFSRTYPIGARTYQGPPIRRVHTSPSPRRISTTSPGGNYQSENRYIVQSTNPGEPTINAIFEKNTGTWQYIVADPTTSRAVIIDPVLDYDRTIQTISTQSADELLALTKECGYEIVMILETHVHADHLTSARYLQRQLAHGQPRLAPICIGRRIEYVQNLFGKRYGISEKEYRYVFGRLFDDDEVFSIGELSAMAIHLPGHTPDHLGYKIGGNVFCGDSVFNADIGTARCDFPGGSAHDLYNSGMKLLTLPDQVKIWTGHDYPPKGRDAPVPWMSVQGHKAHNKHLMEGATVEEFVATREERDKTMSEPKLLHPSLQVNIRGGAVAASVKGGVSDASFAFEVGGGYGGVVFVYRYECTKQLCFIRMELP